MMDGSFKYLSLAGQECESVWFNFSILQDEISSKAKAGRLSFGELRAFRLACFTSSAA